MTDHGSYPARRDCTRCALCLCSFCSLIPAGPCSAPGRRSGSPTAGGGERQCKSSHQLKSEGFEISIRGGKTEPLPSRPSARRAWSSSANREKYILECSMSFFPFTYSSLKYRPRGEKKQQPKDTFHYNLLLLDLHTRRCWEVGSPHPPLWSCMVVPLWLSVEASLEALPGKDKRKEQFWKTGPLWCFERPVKCLLVVAIVCLLFVTSTVCCLFIGHRCVGKQRCVHELYTISTSSSSGAFPCKVKPLGPFDENGYWSWPLWMEKVICIFFVKFLQRFYELLLFVNAFFVDAVGSSWLPEMNCKIAWVSATIK